MDRVSRRQVLAVGAGAALASSLVGTSIANAQGRADVPIQSPWALTLDIALDSRSMDAARQPAAGETLPTGPWYVSGSIYKAMTLGADGIVPSSAQSIGTYRAWGWAWEARAGRTLASQSFYLNRRGEIVASGVMDERFSVEAGTGAFRGANGQADMELLGEMGFRVWFDIATP